MSKKPKMQTATTTQNMSLPSWLEGKMKMGAGQARKAYQQDQTYAPFDQASLTGMQNIENMAMDPSQIRGYQDAMGQYEDTLSGKYLYGGENFNRMFDAASNRIIPQVSGLFNQSGRLGGGAVQSEMARQLGDSFAGLANQERGRMIQALGMAPQMQQLAFDPQARLLGVGGMREQKQLEENMDRTNRLNQYIQQLSSMAPFYQQQTGTQPYFSGGGGLGSMLGAGLSLAGMYMGGPAGLAAGGAGGLLGGAGSTMGASAGGLAGQVPSSLPWLAGIKG